MNKNDLITAVAGSSGFSRNDAGRVIEQTLDTIAAALKRGESVRISGFGAFAVATRKASSGRNPRTGAPMDIKETTRPKFRAGKALRDAVS